ncbi:MAG: response regulator [Methanoregula sp.]|uniref:response regulator n=1 Tax=Methanoregula sp. TaxID=2052170 RepID=UPI003BAF17FF
MPDDIFSVDSKSGYSERNEHVDDDPDLLEICTLFFERTGEIDVDKASSVSDAIKKMASLTYECIISDYQMSGMNGIPVFTGTTFQR